MASRASPRSSADPSAIRAPTSRGRAAPVDPLEGIDLIVFDKDGTLIDFHSMWRDWVDDLGDDLTDAVGRPMRTAIDDLMGVDGRTGRIDPGGLLAATPMSRLRQLVVEALTDEGLDAAAAEAAVWHAWNPPDPVALARPTTDLMGLLEHLRARGIRATVATSDDRQPTERTLEALGIATRIEALVCADDGVAVKPAPDSVLQISDALGVDVDRILVVGDAPADLRMGRAAKVRRVVGVLSGLGDAATLGPLADLVLPSIADLAPG